MNTTASFHNQHRCFDHASSLDKINKVFDFNRPQLKILDLGCGDGRLSYKLIEKGHHVVGVDSSETGLSQAKKVGLETIQANLEKKLPLDDESFDVVLLLDVLEHLYDQSHILTEIFRILKKNGSLILAYPNQFDLRNRLRMLIGRGIIHWSHIKYKNAKAWTYGHIRFLLLKELKKLLHLTGFNLHTVQFNFMAGGLIPTKLTPKIFRKLLLKAWPQLFTGKYVLEVKKNKPESTKKIFIPFTPLGL